MFQGTRSTSSNRKVIEYIKVKLYSPNKKTINIVSICRALSHGFRPRFLSKVEKITNSFYSRQSNIFIR